MKFKKGFLTIILLLFIFPFFTAQTNEIDYTIIGDKVLVEMNFQSTPGLELKIPLDSKALELNTKEYSLSLEESSKKITFNKKENIIIKYITESYLDKSSKKIFFILENNLNFSQNLKIILPEGAVISKGGIFFPEDLILKTDGRRIILEKENFTEQQVVFGYEELTKQSVLIYILFSILILGVIIFNYFREKKIRERIKKIKKITKKKESNSQNEITRNLFEDEKRIIEYLLEKKGKESWTKNISKDLEITKVRLSRKLRSLEQKGLIKKIPYGNENLIKISS